MNKEKQLLMTTLGFPEKEAGDLLSISRRKTLDRHEFFISEGEVPRKFGLLLSGFLRYMYVDKAGNEFTKGLIPENQIFSSYMAMLHEQPSHLSIQALEEAEILEIDYARWMQLRQNNAFWDKFLIRMLEKGYAVKEKRERDLLLLDAETRYLNFLEEFPGMEDRLKQHIIASYLGIKPESLSRIRKKLQPLT